MKIMKEAPFSMAVLLVWPSGVLCRLAKISNNYTLKLMVKSEITFSVKKRINYFHVHRVNFCSNSYSHIQAMSIICIFSIHCFTL